MLRIKDSVNLIGLERFGFEKYEEALPKYIGVKLFNVSESGEYYIERGYCYKDIDNDFSITIVEENLYAEGGCKPERELIIDIGYNDSDGFYEIVDIIYDLIKAGLVEKVGEVADENKGD